MRRAEPSSLQVSYLVLDTASRLRSSELLALEEIQISVSAME